MPNKRIYLVIWLCLTSIFSLNVFAASVMKNPVEIVKHCDNKYAGEDQKTIFTVSIKNKHGRTQNSIYQRFWRNQNDQRKIGDKLSLFTLSPPDAKNTAFLQHSYIDNKAKNAEQWVYLPSLRKIRRTTIRELSDSFLGTDLTFDDIRARKAHEDTHKLLSIDEDNMLATYFIESRPKERSSMYGKKIVTYEHNKQTGVCLKKAMNYYDRNKALIKKQEFSWQKIGKAWLWDTVVVFNAQTFGSSTFKVSRAKVNTRISDKWFTIRMLKRGLR